MPTNAIAKHNPQQVADYFEEFANEEAVGGSDIVGRLLRFNKYGEYKAGQEADDVPEGTRLLVYMPSMMRGWIKWLDNKPVTRKMGLVIDGFKVEDRNTLGDLDKAQWESFEDGREKDPWQKTMTVVMLNPKTQELFTFTTSSVGGKGALSELGKAYSARARMAPDDIPIIDLSMRSYKHAQYGEIRNPVFNIVGWTKVPKTLTELESVAEQKPMRSNVKALPKSSKGKSRVNARL